MGRIPKPCRNGKELLRRRAKFNPMADACCSPVVQVQDSTADTHGEPVLTFTPGGMHVNHPSSQGGKMSRNGPRQGQNASAFSPEICPCFSRMDPGTPPEFSTLSSSFALRFPGWTPALAFPGCIFALLEVCFVPFSGADFPATLPFPGWPGSFDAWKREQPFSRTLDPRTMATRWTGAPWRGGARGKTRCEQTRWDRIRYLAGTSKYPHAHIHTRACEHEVCVPTGCMPHTRMPPLSAMGTQGFKACGNRGCLNRFIVDRYLNVAAWG